MDKQETLEPSSKQKNPLSTKESDSGGNDKQILTEIRTLLTDYLRNRPNISKHSFCMQNKLSFTTVSNLLNGTTQKKPHADTIRKIVFALNNGRGIGTILKEATGAIGKLLRESFVGLENSSAVTDSLGESQKFTQHHDARMISMLAHNANGTTRPEIKEVLGGDALNMLAEMLSMKFLKEQDGRITGTHKSQYIDSYTSMNLATDLVKRVDLEPKEDRISRLTVRSARLTQSQMEKQKKIVDDFYREINKLYENDSPEGTHNFMFFGCNKIGFEPTIEEGIEV